MGLLRLVVLGVWFATGSAGHGQAQNLVPLVSTPGDAVLELGHHMQITQLMMQLRHEGLDGAEKLAEQFEIGRTGGFSLQMQDLFDPAAMEALFLSELQKSLSLDPAILRAGIDFFSTPLGQKVVSAEISARVSVQSDEGEAAAKTAYDALSETDLPRRELIDFMISGGDLVDYNVMGGLNANFAFMSALSGTGVLGEMTEQDMLSRVWQDEETVREEAADWLNGFMAVAYRDLTLQELQGYSDFITSPEGSKLNGALFAAFDTLYRGLSAQQGRITGELMQGDDI